MRHARGGRAWLGAPAWALVALLVCIAWPSPPREDHAPEPPPAPGPVAAGHKAAIWNLLLPRSYRGKLAVNAIAEEIARPGTEVLDPVVSILLEESVQPKVEYEVHPAAIDLRRQILVASLRRLPVRAVVAGLRDHVTMKTSASARLVAIQVLAELGGVDAFDSAIAMAAGFEPVQLHHGFVQGQVEASLKRLVAGDPRLVPRLARALATAPTPVAPLFARTLAASRACTALPALLKCLGRDTALDLCVLAQVARIGDQGDPGFDSQGMRRLRGMLFTSRGDVQRAVAIALGRIGDGESRAGLVELLGDPDPLTAAAARTALETLSGLRLGPDEAAWASWCARENEWLEERLPQLTESFAGADARVVTASLDEMLLHRVHRHQVALAVRPALLSEDPAAQRLTCEALARLGSPRALPWLVEKLDSPHDEVQRAALKALREISRLDLPMNGESWKTALAP